ncbi:alpha/beta hydrolase [Timonella senegalensis]|uniref:alpha/beta hydrolase n=1 Tax=Timonella senegalensis TaxID=1465825 RepID=UPI0028B0620D|nr:alpha/beta hydrolase [Timonella senegalensis]
MSLHPYFRSYLDALNPLVAESVRRGFVATPDSAREALAGLNQFAQPAVPIARVFDTVIAAVPVRVYVPHPEAAADIVLFVHGGGHMAGDLDVYDYSARRTSHATGMVVVSVDYRRSPEAPYPAGLEDTYAVLTQLRDGLEGVETTGTIHAVADSGGGAKLASIAQRVAAGTWESPIERQVLLYPSLDYTLSGQSIKDFSTGYFLSEERIGWYFDHYFAHNEDRAQASPLFGPFNEKMPESLIIAAEFDPLVSEAREYVKAMQQAGSRAHLLTALGMIHAFAFFETEIPQEIETLYSTVGAFLKDGTVSTRLNTGSSVEPGM